MVDVNRLRAGNVTSAERVMEGPSGSQRGPALPRVDTFLEAKLHPPAVRSKWVPRERLLLTLERSVSELSADLDGGSGRIRQDHCRRAVARPADRAEPGVGRARRRRQRPGQVLDPHRHGPRASRLRVRRRERTSLVAQHRDDITDGLLPEIVNALAEAPSPVLLALDDYHFIRSRACHEQVDFLIEHLPPPASALITDPGRSGPASGPSARRPSARRDPRRSASPSIVTRRRPCCGSRTSSCPPSPCPS